MFATDFRSIAGECRFENLQFAFLKLTKTYAGFDRDKGAVSQKSGCAILVRPQGSLISLWLNGMDDDQAHRNVAVEGARRGR